MKNYRSAIWLFLFCLFAYGLFLGNIPLLDPDEPVYGETAKEMIAFSDWFSPRIYGEFWYDKPPLFYWAEAVSFSLFGVSEISARLPSVLFGALTPVYLYLASRKLIGDRAALIGSVICASSLEVIVLARSAVTDTLLTFTLTAALLSFLRRDYLLAYISCGLALLAKGPIGFAFPALIVGLWMLLTGQYRLKNILSLKWYWGIPLACLVGLPWYVGMGLLHGDDFLNTFLGYHNVTRFISPEHEGQNHIYLYLIVLAAGFFPWAGTIPGILARWKTWISDRTLCFFFVWALFIFIFFSLSSTQLFSYILPMYPPLSLLAGKYLTEEEAKGKASRLLLGGHLFFGFLVAAALAAAPIIPPQGKAVPYLLGAAVLCLVLFGAYSLKKGLFSRFLRIQPGLILAVVMAVWTLFAVPVSDSFASRDILRQVKRDTAGSEIPLYIDTFYRPSAAFYENLYGKPLPEFDKKKLKTIEEQEKEGIFLPGKDDALVLPDKAYVLVGKKVYDREWPEEQKKDMTLLRSQGSAYFFLKGASH